MTEYEDLHGQSLRLTEEREGHIRTAHPELTNLPDFLGPTIRAPDRIVRSRTDEAVELFYRSFETIPVTSKCLCAVVKAAVEDPFILTAYFTDSIKRGEVLWTKT
ncbi:MAG: hypothetical protein ABEK75_10470 [Salinibacter sp.]